MKTSILWDSSIVIIMGLYCLGNQMYFTVTPQKFTVPTTKKCWKPYNLFWKRLQLAYKLSSRMTSTEQIFISFGTDVLMQQLRQFAPVNCIYNTLQYPIKLSIKLQLPVTLGFLHHLIFTANMDYTPF